MDQANDLILHLLSHKIPSDRDMFSMSRALISPDDRPLVALSNCGGLCLFAIHFLEQKAYPKEQLRALRQGNKRRLCGLDRDSGLLDRPPGYSCVIELQKNFCSGSAVLSVPCPVQIATGTKLLFA